eukprot:Selendium_serpulae@DN4253_c0_g1_i1.p1
MSDGAPVEEQHSDEDSGSVKDGGDTSPKDETSEKQKGNEAFQEGNIEKAIEHWGRTVRSCRFILSKDAYEGEQKKIVENELTSVYLNLALGNLKLKKFNQALTFCNDAIELDKTNLKALYRKAQAHFGLCDYGDSKSTLQQLLEHHPDNGAAKVLLRDASLKNKELREKEKKMADKVFKGLEHDVRSEMTSEVPWSHKISNFASTAGTVGWVSIEMLSHAVFGCMRMCSRWCKSVSERCCKRNRRLNDKRL